MNLSQLADIFWQLGDLKAPAPNSHKNVYIGYQNQTYCCLEAVRAALTIVDGNLAMNDSSPFINATLDDFV